MTAHGRLLTDRYQVGELLGYGGMAEVHRGRDVRLGRDVAIKMLRTDLARDATFQVRFRREARNAAVLNHPAIVAVYDTGEETTPTGETWPFIVMELVIGWTLKEVLAQEQRIQPRRALEMIAEICSALEFGHRHGIIHRDVKPGNVMVTQNGQVKVMDFGIARAVLDADDDDTGSVIGTAQYLSPEQARGESVDARSDVYAAGCVLFELLVGHPPFVGDSPVMVAYQHVREDPAAPSDINREVPPDVDAIVLKALAKNPLNRYQSAQEMRADALRAVSGRPVLATPVAADWETTAEFLGVPAKPPAKIRDSAGRIARWFGARTPRRPDDDATPPLPIVSYPPPTPQDEFGSKSVAELEALAGALKQQLDEALTRQDWSSASALRTAESAVFTELLHRARSAPPGGETGPPRPGRIFICYRREDSQHVAGRLADRLIGRFGESRVFIDVDSVKPGMDFVEEVRRTIDNCEVLLALIGHRWLDVAATGRRRLDEPDDVVALELREALRSGTRVIPVLLDGAPMPRRDQLPAALEPLTRRNALQLSHETFRSDFEQLESDLQAMLSPGR